MVCFQVLVRLPVNHLSVSGASGRSPVGSGKLAYDLLSDSFGPTDFMNPADGVQRQVVGVSENQGRSIFPGS